MKVIIVGGGLAGLTFANALEKGGIDFVLLEARGRFDPQVGASIGLNAGAMRILDQLGAAQEIIDHTAPVRVSKVHRRDGSLIMAPSPAFQLLRARFGYGVSFLDRQLVLRALFNAIEQKEKLLPNKRVANLEHLATGVSVRCDDQSTYHGDVIVGCDGVNSKSCIRTEMCRIARETDPAAFQDTEITKMTAEYLCLFGISDPVPGLQEGDVDTTVDKGASLLVITGKGGRVFWFYHEKLGRVHQYSAPDFPKFTKADAEAMAVKNAWRMCNETVTLGALWNKRVSYSLVALEEALFDKWSWGRIATVGDNAHKMTPNHGQAGNNAIESAAALANQLKEVQDQGTVDSETISTAFKKWHLKRKARIEATVKEAAAICRLQALDSWKAHFLLFYVMPNATEFLLTLITGTLIGAEILEYLPVPARSFEGSCPFNQRQGVGCEESVLERAAKAAPILLIALWNAQPRHWLTDSPATTVLGFPNASSIQQWRLFVDASLLYAIWLIESYRRANAMTPARLPAVFAILSVFFGPAVIAPCYFFLHYVLSPVENFAAADMRLTHVAYTKTVLPLLLCTMSLPLMLHFAGYSIDTQNSHWTWLWTLLPILTLSVVPRLLLRVGVTSDTMHEDALHNQGRDLPYIYWCIYTLTMISAAVWMLACLYSFDPTLASWQIGFGARDIVTVLTSVYCAGLLWVGLFFYDLKRARMLVWKWVYLLALAAGVALPAGPAFCITLGWMWREEILAARKEFHAITRNRYAGRSIADVEKSVQNLGKTKVIGNRVT